MAQPTPIVLAQRIGSRTIEHTMNEQGWCSQCGEDTAYLIECGARPTP